MKNITLSVDEKVLDEVRTIAAQNKTTVNGLVRDYLTKLAEQRGRAENARKRLLELIDGSTADMGEQKWDRESLYERR